MLVVAVVGAAALLFGAGATEGAGTNPARSHEDVPAVAGEVRQFVPGELLVKFREGVAEQKKERLHREKGASKLRDFKALGLHRLKLKDGVSVEEAIAEYQVDPDVEYAEPNFIISVERSPNDPRYPEQWALYTTAGIDIAAAWDLTTGSREVVVAVVDTGIDYTHSELAANVWNNPGEIPGNGIDDDGNGYIDDVHGINAITGSGNPMDDHRHGTHVAGTIGAIGDNAFGVVGVNWAITLIGCKFLNASGSGNTADAIECFQYLSGLRDRANNPVNILAINNSWGSASYTQALRDAIEAQRDVLFVAAAGNSSRSNDTTPAYPASYPLPNIISVAATDRYDKLASFSNYGVQTVDVAAPGDYILSTIPGNGISTDSGTSMAAPHVTGLAALLASLGKDGKQARNLILAGGDSVASLADRTLTGRRIDAFGSLTCSNRPLLEPLDLPATVTPGVPVILSALSINCETPLGPVTVSVPEGSVALRDDGTAPDFLADDGIFTGIWIPSTAEVRSLTFTSPAGLSSTGPTPLLMSDLAGVMPPVEAVGERSLAAVTGSLAQIQFNAGGGMSPYTWSLAAGTLPPGLSLAVDRGELSGTPTASGKYPVTFRVTDALGNSVVKDWLLIVNEGLRPGWPKVLERRDGSALVFHPSASPVFVDLDEDGKDELIVSDLDSLYLFNAGGLVAKRTLSGWISSPTVADLDQDGVKEIIVNVGYPSALSPSIYAFRRDLTPVPGFPAGKIVTANGGCGFAGTPVVADFNNDGKPSILAVCAPNMPSDTNFKRNVLIMVDAQGMMENGWPIVVGTSGLQEDQIPAVADLDGDGRREIVLSSSDGMLYVLRDDGSEMANWSASQGAKSVHNPILADFDGDSLLDIGIRYGSLVTVFSHIGAPLAGWPRNFSGYWGMTPADLDRDGWIELVLPSGQFWSVWQALRFDGSSPQGWPVTTPVGGAAATVPVIGDVNGDGAQEVLLSLSQPPQVMLAAYTPMGQPLSGYPKYIYPGANLKSSPAIGDLDGNGRVDVAVKAEDGLLYVFESGQGSTVARHEWPMFGHDPQHSNTRPINGPDDLSDLLVTSVTATVVPGTLTYSVTVKNAGVLPAAASVTGLYLASGSDFLIAPVATDMLPAGAEQTLAGTVPLPANIPQGSYTVVAFADTSNSVREGYEENNRTFGNQVELLSDLRVMDVSGAISQGVLSYTVTVANAGAMPAAASTSTLCLTTTADYPVVALATAALPAGTEQVLSGTVALPPDLPPTTFLVTAVADTGNAVLESDETNNRGLGNQVTLWNDLSVAGLSGTIKKGLLNYTVTVSNNGTGLSAASVALYFAPNGSTPADGYLITQLAAGSLAGGAERTLTGTVSLPSVIPAGVYSLAALADPGQEVIEVDEQNNGAVAGQYVFRKTSGKK